MNTIRLIPTPGWEERPSQEIEIDILKQSEVTFQFAETKPFKKQSTYEAYSFDGYEVLDGDIVLFYELFKGKPFVIPMYGGTISIVMSFEVRQIHRMLLQKLYTDQELVDICQYQNLEKAVDDINFNLILNPKTKKKFQKVRKADEAILKAKHRKERALLEVAKSLGLIETCAEEDD